MKRNIIVALPPKSSRIELIHNLGTSLVILNGQTIFQFNPVLVIHARISKTVNGRSLFTLATHRFETVRIEYDPLDQHLTQTLASLIEDLTLGRIKSLDKTCCFFLVSDKTKQAEFVAPSGWRCSSINIDRSICPTYPSIVKVPISVSDSVIRHAARFRVHNRFPILSYHSSKFNGCIVRASQPLQGLANRRSIQDEYLINAIRLSSRAKSLLIADLRPRSSALVNRVKGAGSTDPTTVVGSTRIFAGIHNIHHVTHSYLNRISSLLKIGENEQWSHMYTAIMRNAVRPVVDAVTNGLAVLVHCSDGWDRTPQVLSLARLVLDSNDRTKQGFLDIILNEWILSGHKFAERCGSSLGPNIIPLDTRSSFVTISKSMLNEVLDPDDEKYRDQSETFSPIFPQFLDCTLQLLRHFPDAFEFDDSFIYEIWHQYSLGLFNFDISNAQVSSLSLLNSCSDTAYAAGISFGSPQNMRPSVCRKDDLEDKSDIYQSFQNRSLEKSLSTQQEMKNLMPLELTETIFLYRE